jgi:hypothetical protein
MKDQKMLVYLIIPLGLLIFGLLGYYLFIVIQKPCINEGWPMPAPASLRFGPYYMITDQGPLYIGQTYEHQNEGSWVGNLTLLFLDQRGATFLLRYPNKIDTDFKIMQCRKYYQRTMDNQAIK